MRGVLGLLEAQQREPQKVVQFRRFWPLLKQSLEEMQGFGEILYLEKCKDKLRSDVRVLPRELIGFLPFLDGPRKLVFIRLDAGQQLVELRRGREPAQVTKGVNGKFPVGPGLPVKDLR